jgi:hypothetical protein
MSKTKTKTKTKTKAKKIKVEKMTKTKQPATLKETVVSNFLWVCRRTGRESYVVRARVFSHVIDSANGARGGKPSEYAVIARLKGVKRFVSRDRRPPLMSESMAAQQVGRLWICRRWDSSLYVVRSLEGKCGGLVLVDSAGRVRKGDPSEYIPVSEMDPSNPSPVSDVKSSDSSPLSEARERFAIGLQNFQTGIRNYFTSLSDITEPVQPDVTEPVQPDVTEPVQPDVTEPVQPDVTEPVQPN